MAQLIRISGASKYEFTGKHDNNESVDAHGSRIKFSIGPCLMRIHWKANRSNLRLPSRDLVVEF
jgi:hypothetical protein